MAKGFVPKESILITWTATTGTEPSLAILREHLSRYTVSQVLVALSQVAGVLKTWRNDPDHKLDHRLQEELLPSHIQATKRFRTDKHIVFGRISLLYVAKQACIACLPDTETLEQPEDMESIFSCCLI